MEFRTDIDPKQYDTFVREHPLKSHFMQSLAWGELNRTARGMTPYYTGLVGENGQLMAAALLLEKKPPIFPPYFYSPRGYVLDFSNEKLLAEFTDGVCAFAKQKGAMFVALDPDIELQNIDEEGHPVVGTVNNRMLVERMKALAYRHRGYNKEFEGRQPRYTFRIDLAKGMAEIDKNIAGSVRKSLAKSKHYALSVDRGDSGDIADLHRLIGITSERADYVAYGKEYYQSFYDVLNAFGMVTLWIGTAYPKQTARLLQKEREALLLKRETLLNKPGPLQETFVQENRLTREIALFEEYAEQYPEGARLCAHLLVHYGDKVWAVHGGNDRAMSETCLNIRTYYEKLQDAWKSGARIFDQVGTVGDPQHSPLKGLHEFKKKFGGRYIEFVGEFDLVLKPFWFFLYEKALPLYRKIRIGLKLALRPRHFAKNGGKKDGETSI